jgi:hypothetical protein
MEGAKQDHDDKGKGLKFSNAQKDTLKKMLLLFGYG